MGWFTDGSKAAINFLKPNAAKAWNFMHSTPVGSSFTRWAAAGAVVGGIRGLADNVVGEDRVSVIGGMMQGAIMGAGIRGVGHGWRNRGKAANWVSSKLGTNAVVAKTVAAGVSPVSAASSSVASTGFTMSGGSSVVTRGRARKMLTDQTGKGNWSSNRGALSMYRQRQPGLRRTQKVNARRYGYGQPSKSGEYFLDGLTVTP